MRNAVEAIGKLVFWRVAIKPGRPVAMGVISGERADANAAFVGLPGNPVAAFITFVRVVRPLIMRLSGAVAAPLVALPVRAAFPYRKKKGRREYVRVALKRADDGMIEALKHKQDGAGIITSLTETDGLVELLEDTTDIAAGRYRRLSALRRFDRLWGPPPPLLPRFGKTVTKLRATRDLVGASAILRRIHVEERIDRLVGPFGNGDAMPRGPHFDLVQVFVHQRVTQVVTQRHIPQTDHRMPPFARARAGEF